MTTVVEPIPNEAFQFPFLGTKAGSVISRRRTKYPPNQSVTFGNASSQGQLQSTTVFDVMDPSDFINMKSLIIQGNLIPSFIRDFVSEGSASNVHYAEGAAPSLDQDTQALIARLRIGNQAGLVIEEIFVYGLYSNVVKTFSESAQHKEFSLTDHSSLRWSNQLPYHKGSKSEWLDQERYFYDNNSRIADNVGKLNVASLCRVDNKAIVVGSQTNNNQARNIIIPLEQSSILEAMSFLPIRLFDHGLRIEIDWADPRFCFYNNHMGLPPQYKLSIKNVMSDLDSTGNYGADVTAQSAANGSFTIKFDTTYGFGGSITAAKNELATLNPWWGEFWLLKKDGVPVTIVYAQPVETKEATDDTLTLHSETSTATSRGLGSVVVGRHVAALQQIYGVSPAGGGSVIGALNYGNVTLGTPIAAGSLSLANGAEIKGVFNEIWSIPPEASPVLNPGSILAPSMAVDTQKPQWQYAFQDLSLLTDLVLPSDTVRAAYQAAFMSPQGISYPYQRVMWQVFTSQSPPSNGVLQFLINARPKSLRGVLMVLTDPFYGSGSNTDLALYNGPWLSSFRMCGLKGAYLQCGGQQYPAQALKFDTSMIETGHYPELMSMMNASINSNVTPTFAIGKLHREGRNYGKCGTFTNSTNIVPYIVPQDVSRRTAAPIWGGSAVSSYIDTSKFVLGFNTMKVDQDRFSGIDVSNSGGLIINLDMADWGVRQYVAHFFMRVDAVCTIQESNSVVRM